MSRRFAVLLCAAALAALGACSTPRQTSEDACPAAPPALSPDASSHALKTVFVIVFENQDWSAIEGNPSAPYINETLLPAYAHAENYRNGGVHPSLPSYIMLEAGSTLGVTTDDPPSRIPLPVPCHLSSWLTGVGLSWKAYAQGTDGTTCPIANAGRYAVRHVPFVYFEDVSGSPPSAGTPGCIAHVRPYEELSADLEAGTVARYDFITPDLCNDGHDACPPLNDRIAQSDAFLAEALPPILASNAYRDGGVVLITWDESAGKGDAPIGLIAVSPLAKPGYSNRVAYSHASTLRTVQEILGVTPLLRHAADATSLSDLFTEYP